MSESVPNFSEKASITSKFSSQFNGAINYTADVSRQAQKTASNAISYTSSTAKSAIDFASAVAYGAFNFGYKTTENVALKTVNAAVSTAQFGVNTASTTYGYALSTASHATSSMKNVATKVFGYANSTASSTAAKTIDLTRSVTWYTANTSLKLASSTAETFKPYLPEIVNNANEKALLIANEAVADPLKAAKDHLPESVYGTLEWGSKKGFEITESALSTATSTKDYAIGVAVSANEYVTESGRGFYDFAKNQYDWAVSFTRRA